MSNQHKKMFATHAFLKVLITVLKYFMEHKSMYTALFPKIRHPSRPTLPETLSKQPNIS